jgi:hypothetical protein
MISRQLLSFMPAFPRLDCCGASRFHYATPPVAASRDRKCILAWTGWIEPWNAAFAFCCQWGCFVSGRRKEWRRALDKPMRLNHPPRRTCVWIDAIIVQPSLRRLWDAVRLPVCVHARWNVCQSWEIPLAWLLYRFGLCFRCQCIPLVAVAPKERFKVARNRSVR